MTRNQEKEVRSKLTKWLAGKTSDSFDLESKVSGWVDYFRTIPSPVTCLAACSWLCSGAVVLPEDMPKVEQAVKVARLNRVDPLRYGRPMDIIETFATTEVKEHPIDPDTVPTLHLNRKFDSGLAIYDVDESQESRENMRRIINTHFGKESSPWCLLQGDGNGNLTEDSASYWESYSAYPKQVAFVDGRLAAFSADMDTKDMPWWDLDENVTPPSIEERTWWDRMDSAQKDVVISGRIKGDVLKRSADKHFDTTTGAVEYGNIFRRTDSFIIEHFGNIVDTSPNNVEFYIHKREMIQGAIRIPEGVTEIRRFAFYGCENLREIHLPEGLEKIRGGTFYGCKSLREIHLPEGLKEIGRDAFCRCESLREIHLPEGLKKIGSAAFYGCKKLQETHLPEGLENIGYKAFCGCEKLQEIHIPESVTNIEGEAFCDCENLREIHLPEGLEKIRGAAFYGCKSLREIHLPEGLKEIGRDAFCGCKSLREIHLPEGLENIGYKAFCGCKSLREIHLPEGLKEIGRDAFNDEDSLEKVTLPADAPAEWDHLFHAGCEIVRRPNCFDKHTLFRLEKFGLSAEETETLRRTCDIVFFSQAGPVPLSYRGGEIFVGERKMPLGQAMHELKKNPKFIDSFVPALEKTPVKMPHRQPDMPYRAHGQTIR